MRPVMWLMLLVTVVGCRRESEAERWHRENLERCRATAEPAACWKVGLSHSMGEGARQDDALAVTMFRQACDAGLASGCTSLGFHAAYGRGEPGGVARAQALYVKGCDGDHAEGCANLAAVLEEGYGDRPDPKAALALYEKACALKDEDSCYQAARLLTTVLPDRERAGKRILDACRLAHLDLCDDVDGFLASDPWTPKP